jgi:G:T-mismatch repair DNA endonuclease (very short patch repair protein)
MNDMAHHQQGVASFKGCSICNKVWKNRDGFLDDPDIVIVGYQVHFEDLTEGLFLFNHTCRGTLTPFHIKRPTTRWLGRPLVHIA